MTGVVLGLITVGLAVLGRYIPGAKPTLGEEILTASLAFLFVALGVLFQTVYNGMQTKLALETLRIGGERNVMVHEETMEKLKLLPISPTAANPPSSNRTGASGPSPG